MPTVHIVKLLCQKGHVLYAAMYEEGVGSLDEIKSFAGPLSSALGVNMGSCGLCGPTVSRWVDTPTSYTSMAAAAGLFDAVMKEVEGLKSLVEIKRGRESITGGLSTN